MEAVILKNYAPLLCCSVFILNFVENKKGKEIAMDIIKCIDMKNFGT
jgi:hypothetical protein